MKIRNFMKKLSIELPIAVFAVLPLGATFTSGCDSNYVHVFQYSTGQNGGLCTQ